MRKLLSLFLITMLMCWSMAIADQTPTRGSADVSFMPGFNTSNVESAPDLLSTDISNIDKRHIDQIDISGTPGQRPVILTNYLFDDFEDGNYTSSPTWTMTSNGNGTGVEDWTVYADPWSYSYGTVTHNGTGYLVGSDSDGGGALADEELEISFNTPGGGGQLTLYYWVHFRAYAPSAEYFEVLVDDVQVDLVTAPDDTPVVGDRTVVLDSYNDGNAHTLTMHYYADYGYVAAFDDVVITDDPRPVGACCNDNNGACVDNVEQSQCPLGVPGVRWVANTLCADLIPPCGAVYGACCDDQGNCTQTAEVDCPGLWLEETPCDPNPCPTPPPCTLSCPPNGILEGEPDCYEDYVDNYNGGCNSDPPIFSNIAIGDTVCGKAGNYISHDGGEPNNSRDTDWYELTVTSDNTLYFFGIAEFDFQLLLMDAGTGDCVDYSVLSGEAFDACSTGVVSAPVCPGTYWLWVGPADFVGTACGSNYQIWAELGPPPTGACCVDLNCVATNTLCECDALGGNWYPGETCPAFDCPILVDCENAVWMNGLATGNIWATQCDPVYPMQAGVADDFILSGTDPVTLEYVVAWAGHWNATPAATPADYISVNVSIYANDDSFTPPRPGGKPIDGDTLCTHTDIIPDGLVYFTSLPQGSFGYVDDGGGVWRLMIPVNITLDAGVTYWLEVQPELVYVDHGQSGWINTDITQGEYAVQIFELLGTMVWTTLDGNIDMAFCLLAAGGSGGCDYVVGDVNGSSNYNGLDITYGVAFFKGGNPPQCDQNCPPCSGWHYCGDVNASCNYNGLDITYGVSFFKGGAAPIPCADCPPNE